MPPRPELSSRRCVLAAAALAGLPAWSSVPARASAGASLGHVVVVGGGYGGSTAARCLRLSGAAIEVTLVERQPQFISCPLSNLVVAGFRPLADITRGYEGLQALGVKVLQGEVQDIDAAARRLRLADGRALAYDRLILAPGIDFMLESIGGLATALARGDAVHAWKAGAQTLALRRQLEAMPDGGVFVLSIPRAPFRCPPAPYERACLVAAYLKRHKPRAKLLVMDANSEIQSKRSLFERAFRTDYAGLLEYHPDSELREVDAKTARFEFEDLRADVLNIVPPQRGADIARQAGLLNINQRWVGVDWLSLEATAAPGIHVLGDALFPGPAMPKSGHMASQQGRMAAAAVLQLLKGEALDAAPVLRSSCYSFVSAEEAIHLSSVHEYDAAERTMVPRHGATQVSPAASRAEGREAWRWAQGIWQEMLGAPS